MPQLFSKGYAVVIGVGADLPVTIKDADAIATQLRDPTRCAFPHDQVRLLTHENACRGNILTALDWLSDKAEQDDTVIIYFSGHGMEAPGFHLVPFGYDGNNLTNTAITGQEFTACLRSIQAKKLLVLLDCCHAGGQAEAKGYSKSPLPSAVIHELGKSSGRVVLASSRKDELSWTGRPYSEFTMAVLEGLSGYGAFEQDGYARVLDLAFWVSRVVPERTKDKQHPIIKVSNLEDNFALAWYSGGDKAPKSLPWNKLTSVPNTPNRTGSPELATWQRMRANYRRNLLLIEERMSEYVDSVSIPIQLVKEKRETEAKITEIEQKLSIDLE